MPRDGYIRLVSRPWCFYLIAIFGYLIGALAVCHRVFSILGSGYLGAGDAPQTLWFLSWDAFAVTHRISPFITDFAGKPYGGANLLWNASVMAVGIPFAPVTLLFGPYVTYNVALIGAFVANALACCFAARHLGCKYLASFIAGAAYGFSPFFAAHGLGHLNLMLGFVPPIAVVLFYEIVVAQRASWRWLSLMTATAVVLQYFLFQEGLILMGILGGIAVILVAFLRRSPVTTALRFPTRVVGAAAGIALVVLEIPLYVQLAGPWRLAGFTFPSERFQSDLIDLVLPSRAQVLATSAMVRESIAIHYPSALASAYLGVPLLLALIACSITFRRDIILRLAIILAGASILLGLGPRLHVLGYPLFSLPWAAALHVPFVADVLPERFSQMEDLFLAISVGRVLTLGPPLISALFCLTLVPLAPAALPATPGPFVPPIFSSSSELAGHRVLLLPFISEAHVDGALWQVASGFSFKTPGQGLITYGPFNRQIYPLFTDLILIGQGKPTQIPIPAYARKLMHDEIRRTGVDLVILGPMGDGEEHSAYERLITDLFDQAPANTAGVLMWRTPPALTNSVPT